MVLSRSYAAEAIRSDELTSLQDAITNEGIQKWPHPLFFSGIYFRMGLLLIDCRIEESVSRLTEDTLQLERSSSLYQYVTSLTLSLVFEDEEEEEEEYYR